MADSNKNPASVIENGKKGGNAEKRRAGRASTRSETLKNRVQNRVVKPPKSVKPRMAVKPSKVVKPPKTVKPRKAAKPRNVARPPTVLNQHIAACKTTTQSAPLKSSVSEVSSSDNGFIHLPNVSPIEDRFRDFDTDDGKQVLR